MDLTRRAVLAVSSLMGATALAGCQSKTQPEDDGPESGTTARETGDTEMAGSYQLVTLDENGDVAEVHGEFHIDDNDDSTLDSDKIELRETGIEPTQNGEFRRDNDEVKVRSGDEIVNLSDVDSELWEESDSETLSPQDPYTGIDLPSVRTGDATIGGDGPATGIADSALDGDGNIVGGGGALSSAVVYTDGSTYYAVDDESEPIDDGSDFSTVLQSAFDNADGGVSIAAGVYDLDSEVTIGDGQFLLGAGARSPADPDAPGVLIRATSGVNTMISVDSAIDGGHASGSGIFGVAIDGNDQATKLLHFGNDLRTAWVQNCTLWGGGLRNSENSNNVARVDRGPVWIENCDIAHFSGYCIVFSHHQIRGFTFTKNGCSNTGEMFAFTEDLQGSIHITDNRLMPGELDDAYIRFNTGISGNREANVKIERNTFAHFRNDHPVVQFGDGSSGSIDFPVYIRNNHFNGENNSTGSALVSKAIETLSDADPQEVRTSNNNFDQFVDDPAVSIPSGPRISWDEVLGGGPIGGIDLTSVSGEYLGQFAIADGTSTEASGGDFARWDGSEWQVFNGDETVSVS